METPPVDSLTRDAQMLPWFPVDLTHVDPQQTEPPTDFFEVTFSPIFVFILCTFYVSFLCCELCIYMIQEGKGTRQEMQHILQTVVFGGDV